MSLPEAKYIQISKAGQSSLLVPREKGGKTYARAQTNVNLTKKQQHVTHNGPWQQQQLSNHGLLTPQFGCINFCVTFKEESLNLQ